MSAASIFGRGGTPVMTTLT
uniref:Uncharacterized protein n=1 Tax=Anguilla anguilla TaxID=7936 RepID=A0A0E9RZR2_ANGAN